MGKYDDIRNEIISAVKIDDNFILEKVQQELDILEQSEGLNGVNNLKEFYSIWKEHLNEKGTKNKINSWVAWAIGLTSEKPEDNTKFLPLRRAYARAGYPDIDTDFCYFRRQEVIDYKKRKYGDDYTANIGTYGTMGLRSSITRVAKALDVAGAFHKGDVAYKTENVKKVNEILLPIPKGKGLLQAKDPETGENMKVKTIKDAMKCFKDFNWYMNDKYPNVKKHSQAVEGLIQNFTVHAAGVIISSDPLKDIVPIIRCANGVATQYPNEDLEEMGILKFDDLGVSTLTTIDETIKLIKENYDIDIDLNAIPIDDPEVYKMYQSGVLDGVFQCEEPGMQAVLRKMKPTEFNDIMAANALVRPGPSKFVPQYCSCKEGKSNPDYFHSSIEKHVKPYLKNTYGIMVYQEQIMQICNALAGFSITNGYIMIKAVGKKIEVLLKRFKEQFISGCVKNDVPEKVAESYWKKCIIPFADYGFNKCLSGNMRVFDNNSGKFYTLEDLFNQDITNQNIELLSLDNGEIKNDLLIDIFETGENDLYEVELDNGMIVECTLNHKFYCSDNKDHMLREIIDQDLEMLSITEGENMKKCKVKSVKFLGKKKTYNLTMKSKQHNYAIYDAYNCENFVISKNSHSCAYSLTSYWTCYLKVHYPEEFMVSLLNVENLRKKFDLVEKYEGALSTCKIKLGQKEINSCGVKYKIIKKADRTKGDGYSVISPTLMVKGIGENAAQEVEDNAPYKDLKDLAQVASVEGANIKKDTIGCLYDGGFFRGYIKNRHKTTGQKLDREGLVELFDSYRKDFKVAAGKGVISQNMFDG